jgi:quercetin dioxygenase-like cupin family protein
VRAKAIAGPGSVWRRGEFEFRRRDGALVQPLVDDRRSDRVAVSAVEVPAGCRWQPAGSADSEQVAVVFDGAGVASLDARSRRLARADAVYSATGTEFAVAAAGGPLSLYVWETSLRPAERPGPSPRTAGSLWDDRVQLTGFTGTGEAPVATRTARMNFVFWPGTGCPRLCLHCGLIGPGETFNVHTHPASDDAFLAFDGTGQFYLGDRWVDVQAGDLLFAPAGVPHGARNQPGNPHQLVACGGPTPFDPMLYQAAGVSAEVV